MDTRFSYCALAACALLRRLPSLDVAAAARFVRSCANVDGGVGATPGGESHAGQIFTALGATRQRATWTASLESRPLVCTSFPSVF